MWSAFRKAAGASQRCPQAAVAATVVSALMPTTSSSSRCHVTEDSKHGKVGADVRRAMERMASLAPEVGGSAELMGKLRALEDDWWMRGKIHRVVLTGGPCGGKSTVMTDIQQMLRERNYLVFSMPEVCTQMYMWSDGKMWDDFSAEGPEDDDVWAALQVTVTRVQMVVEDSILQMAKRSLAKRRHTANPPRGAVILLDRGVVDNKAYCTKEAWTMVLQELGTTTPRLRDLRYDHVVHLVSAANGAESFYTLEQAEGAGARLESLEEARKMDDKTQEVWRGAKSHFIVGNHNTDFEQKRRNVLDIVRMIIGDNLQVSPMLQIKCQHIPWQDITKAASEDPSIPWVVNMHIVITYLNKTTRLQKIEVKNEGTHYYQQEVSEDGRHVTMQYQMDSWSYIQKIQAVQSGLDVSGSEQQSTSGALRVVEVDRVTFIYNQQLMRCNCVHDKDGEASPKLIVEVQPGNWVADILPPWLPKSTSEEPDAELEECL